MVLKADQQRVKALLTETVTLLCKNGLHFKSELCIEGLIGITLDQEEIFLVNIKEMVKLNKPVTDSENIKSPAPFEPAFSAKKTRPRRACSEISSQAQAAIDSGQSSSKLIPAAAPEEPLVSNLENPSTSGHRSCSPAVPSTVKSQAEDTSLRLPSSKPSELVTSERPVSFYDVPIKLDYELGTQTLAEETVQPSEVHPDEPACKRLRTRSQGHAAETQSSTEPSSREMPSQLSACKRELSDVIEIKEESLSDSEMTKNSIAEYSSYEDYSTMAYGSGDLDASQMYGESSSFQSGVMYQDDMQGNLGSETHELVSETEVTERPLFYSPRGRPSRSVRGTRTCSQCGRSFKSDNTLKYHERLVHQGLYRYVCKICGKGTRGISDLRGHMASKHNQPRDFKCEICHQEFAYKCHLKEHMLAAHRQVLKWNSNA